MLSSPLLQSLRRLWALDKFAYSLRVFVALSGVMLACWLQGRPELVIPLFLGVIASALAETDDHWLGRLQALLVTLACFTIASLAVELLFPYPPLFVAGLALSTFAMTLLGALGERYAAIASATLILSIYTMIGVDQRGGTPTDFWHEPLLLVAGALWYGLLSVLWNALFANQPVQQSLAKLFLELGEYLKIKSTLLEPLRQLDVEAQRLALARQNGRVVVALNQAKETILARLSHGRPSPKISRYLKLYFIAQDVHERASSSHYPYNQLAEAFFHSDVLFRCQRLLNQQGKACKALAKAIQLRHPFDYNDSELALADLNASLEYLRQQGNPAWRGLLRSLGALAANLTTLDRKLSGASNPDMLDDEQDSTLLDRSPRSFKDALERIRLQVSPTSLLFRHALRLSLALAAGYGMLHLIHPTQGYWIMLTTVFVCQPNYGATRIRMVQRILGTLVGLVAGWALIDLFPNPLIQSLLAVVAGVAFFATRSTRYTLATAAITLLVLFCFNQVGDGYGLILPRLFDTLLGALIAGIAVFLVLPDWHGRSLHRLVGGTLACNSRYLREIMQQYANGKRDDLAYRTARRNAHNADATLSTTLSNMLLEPGHFRKDAEIGFRFLVLSHTLLSYLSALGAHRNQLPPDVNDDLIAEAAERLTSSLDDIAARLNERRAVAIYSDEEDALAKRLEELPEEQDDAHRLVQTQLALICRQLTPLRTLAAHLLKKDLGAEQIEAA
ncbi:YccS family putative transporter [Pseudomonas sp. BGr12]|uniref:YccS family putative transporter n=1 Tax=unclassified Pseudomonas TaxID=196821 RepID=UPI00177D310B|nr:MULTISPECIES: YccS family putative transporter [unclassified Pseudomonas]MBD9576935.1 TIGR01666 family membrane protein [Pseudomonas sp. PDM23]MDL2429241.1 YccS family putative transporter [Pseudomonas sp. BJa5]